MSGANGSALAPGRGLRSAFPIFERRPHGQRLAYLDNAASAQKPEAVIQAVDTFYRRHYANVHRGIHSLSEEASARYEAARERVARFLGAEDPAEVVLTRGTTEAINLVAGSLGQDLGPGDAILLTEMEHHANLVPWQLLAERRGVELRYLRLTDEGRLDLDALDELLDERVRLLAFVHVSNVLGTRNPVPELVAAARRVGARVLLDAAQSASHEALDVGALGVDFLAFSGHKVYGPTGIGALWARRALLEALPPWQGGGEMIAEVTLEGARFAPPPHKFEAGTPPIAQAVGLAAALDFIDELGLARVAAHTAALTAEAIEALGALDAVRVLGPPAGEARGPVVAFTVEGVHPHDLATIADHQGVALRAGHHCAMPLHRRLGVPASARVSFAAYNDRDDVEALLAALAAARRVFAL